MLESDTLWIGSRASNFTRAARDRTFQVRISERGSLVGTIVASPLRWLPWAVRWWLTVFEEPDASVLFTARRAGWLPADWDVMDADGRLVALLRSVYILGAEGEVLGRRSRRPGGVVEPDGRESARWRHERAATCIEFAHELDQPFLRMATVVAAMLDAS